MATTYLSRTNSSGNQRKLTLSMWIKSSNGLSGTDGGLFLAQESGTAPDVNLYYSNGVFTLGYYNGSSWVGKLATVLYSYRDPSAWLHIVAVIDTANATSGDRLKMYINGTRLTTFSNETQPSQNTDFASLASGTVKVGVYRNGTSYYDGSIAHYHYCDGYAYDASTFGESDSTSGIWKPKTAPSVTYGNNGFFLKMENSGAMGTDSSGNSNTFTVSGNLTQNVDTPSNNFATLNALDNYYAGATLSNGNTKSVTGTNTAQVLATMGVSTGKWYWEVKATNLPSTYGTIGICPTSPTATGNYISSRANEYMYYSAGNLYYNGGSTGTYASYTTGDIIGVAMDLDNNRLFFSKNGTWQNSADPTTSTGAYTITAPASTDSGFYFPAVGYWDTGNGTFECNFGQGYFGTTAVASAGTAPSEGGIFEYDCPNSYQALCTKGINSF